MPSTLVTEFGVRRQQVKRYVAIVLGEERRTSAGKSRPFVYERLNVLKAGSFLILYNLVEASARSAMEAIHDDMKSTRAPFEALRPDLRREVIKGFKRNASPDGHRDMTDVPVSLVAASLDAEFSFSGNVDAKLLREISELYGYSCTTDAARTRNGADLLTIKTNRNDLAHGRKTYEDVGRSYTARELLEISLRSTTYVGQIIANVDAYVAARGYLEPIPPDA